jgi:hypothetical protein
LQDIQSLGVRIRVRVRVSRRYRQLFGSSSRLGSQRARSSWLCKSVGETIRMRVKDRVRVRVRVRVKVRVKDRFRVRVRVKRWVCVQQRDIRTDTTRIDTTRRQSFEHPVIKPSSIFLSLLGVSSTFSLSFLSVPSSVSLSLVVNSCLLSTFLSLTEVNVT